MAENAQPATPQPEFLPGIRRARFAKLTICEISDSELEILELGSPGSIYLNFAIFLLSSAISITVTLLVANIASDKMYMFFVVVTVVGYIIGELLLLLWWKDYRSVLRVADTIRRRLPPEGEAAPLPGERA